MIMESMTKLTAIKKKQSFKYDKKKAGNPTRKLSAFKTQGTTIEGTPMIESDDDSDEVLPRSTKLKIIQQVPLCLLIAPTVPRRGQRTRKS